MEEPLLRTTEKENPASRDLDLRDTRAILRLMNDEDYGVVDAVSRCLADIERAVDAVAAALDRGGRLFYVGSGTSGRVGGLDAVEWRPTFGTPRGTVRVLISGGVENALMGIEVRGREDEDASDEMLSHHVGADDVALGITASGRTPYVCTALACAKRSGAYTIMLCASLPSGGSPVDLIIHTDTGPEIITGSTRLKAATAAKMVLNMISTAAMVKRGWVYGNLMVGVVPDNAKLKDRAVRIIHQITGRPMPVCRHVLEDSGGRVKTAVVMLRKGLTLEEADARLRRHRGNLRKVLDA